MMRNNRFTKKSTTALKQAAILLFLSIATVWATCPRHGDAGGNGLVCSDVTNCDSSNCNDSCPTCFGYTYDYQNNGTMNCTLINRGCSDAGTGCSDCTEISYTVNAYYYDNAYPYGCPPCIRSYH